MIFKGGVQVGPTYQNESHVGDVVEHLNGIIYEMLKCGLQKIRVGHDLFNHLFRRLKIRCLWSFQTHQYPSGSHKSDGFTDSRGTKRLWVGQKLHNHMFWRLRRSDAYDYSNREEHSIQQCWTVIAQVGPTQLISILQSHVYFAVHQLIHRFSKLKSKKIKIIDFQTCRTGPTLFNS